MTTQQAQQAQPKMIDKVKESEALRQIGRKERVELADKTAQAYYSKMQEYGMGV